jgi:hypothetical protein
MEKAARSSLLGSWVLSSFLALGGCAHPARELPPDISSADAQRMRALDRESGEYAMSCDALSERHDAVAKDIVAGHEKLRQVRDGNQGKALAGLFILTPIWLSMENGTDDRKKLDELENQKERIERIRQARGCARPAT